MPSAPNAAPSTDGWKRRSLSSVAHAASPGVPRARATDRHARRVGGSRRHGAYGRPAAHARSVRWSRAPCVDPSPCRLPASPSDVQPSPRNRDRLLAAHIRSCGAIREKGRSCRIGSRREAWRFSPRQEARGGRRILAAPFRVAMRSQRALARSALVESTCFVGPLAFGLMSNSNMSVGMAMETQALGMSTTPPMRPSTGAQPRIT